MASWSPDGKRLLQRVLRQTTDVFDWFPLGHSKLLRAPGGKRVFGKSPAQLGGFGFRRLPGQGVFLHGALRVTQLLLKG